MNDRAGRRDKERHYVRTGCQIRIGLGAPVQAEVSSGDDYFFREPETGPRLRPMSQHNGLMAPRCSASLFMGAAGLGFSWVFSI